MLMIRMVKTKMEGLGSIYFKFASQLATIFFDEIIDSVEMSKVRRK